ncbi:hypothetical protein DdX_21035 [Ditylenchus destructor]|uniref:Uncharacterized protein n=1 Tax=Ditylenchus destructor TaxID=166010 RepID=A0AAD4QW17_9BILA|nr:hypothetical protein DdX_21035 [Ditylenchus destructor]
MLGGASGGGGDPQNLPEAPLEAPPDSGVRFPEAITFRAWLGSGWVIAHFAWLAESCRLVYHSPGSELG